MKLNFYIIEDEFIKSVDFFFLEGLSSIPRVNEQVILKNQIWVIKYPPLWRPDKNPLEIDYCVKLREQEN